MAETKRFRRLSHYRSTDLTGGDKDRDLIAKSLQGNQKAFRELVGRHHATAAAVVRGVLGDRDGVEDVLQIVYLKVHRGLPGFRGDAKFSTWIYQIARNESINFVKRRRFETTPIEDVTLEAPGGSADRSLERRETSELLDGAMATLEEGHRMALELRYMGERSYEEIAEIMDVPLGTVKTYIHRGKAALKKALSPDTK